MFYFSIFLITIPIRFIYVQIESEEDFSLELSVLVFNFLANSQPGVQITAHIRTYNLDITYLVWNLSGVSHLLVGKNECREGLLDLRDHHELSQLYFLQSE